MSAYTDHKDAFDSDTGLWTVQTTNGSSSISGGGRHFDKTSDAWNQTGMFYPTTKAWNYGDAVEVQFQMDEATAGNTYLKIGWRNNPTPALSDSGEVGAYIYSDGGVLKAHGSSSGVCVDLTRNEAMVAGETYTMKWSVALVTGFMKVQIKGGVFGSEYVDLTGTTALDVVVLYTNVSFMFLPYSTDSGFSVLNYEWYDSAGPDPAPGGDDPSGHDLPCQMCNSQGWF